MLEDEQMQGFNDEQASSVMRPAGSTVQRAVPSHTAVEMAKRVAKKRKTIWLEARRSAQMIFHSVNS